MTIENGSAELVLSTSNLQQSINALKSGSSNVLSTFEGGEFADKIKVIAAMTSAKPIADNLGTIINLRNVVVQPVDMPVDEKDESKGTAEVPRIILVDEDGTAYAAISSGIFKSLENIFGVLGQPATWPTALPVVVTEEKSRKGFKFFTLSIASN